VLKLIATILTLAPMPARKQIATSTLQKSATYSNLGTITSDPWAGWMLHPRLDP